jgi:putative pyruvate formate lyase activating enzyme
MTGDSCGRRRASSLLHRQVGDLVMDEHGVAQHGVLVRHLVMPGDVAGTTQIMHWLAGVSTDMYVNLMAQYAPGSGDSMSGTRGRRRPGG